jgi:serine/threonine protein kinase
MAFKGEYPFFDQGRKYRSINEYFKELKIRKLIIPPNNGRSEDLVDLIKKMLCKDHEERISWKELFEHPKIVKAVRT